MSGLGPEIVVGGYGLRVNKGEKGSIQTSIKKSGRGDGNCVVDVVQRQKQTSCR